jgi:hypothetical protein
MMDLDRSPDDFSTQFAPGGINLNRLHKLAPQATGWIGHRGGGGGEGGGDPARQLAYGHWLEGESEDPQVMQLMHTQTLTREGEG